MSTNITNDDALNEEQIHELVPVSGLYERWFIDYASYVILERAIPNITDGLKPVQRRILHSMKEMDDGRYNKVANIIGSTMQYHPHGDAAIGDALVNMGQKDLLIDTQGNWGDIRTGDSAAAARYIEARLSKFALEVLFNSKTTVWGISYDGRKREPNNLPAKFPLLLAQGTEGIAVGLSTKILPHNFIELCEASILYLQKKPFEIYPDFLTGGFIDVSNYNEGSKGSKIRIRAHIEEFDKRTLLIKNIPFGTTTTSVIESIVKANDNGKIKIKKVTDNTAKDVEIQILLTPGVSPNVTIDALYAFTDCEVSVSPNACLIIEDKPHFVSVHKILKECTDQTKELLRLELEIKLFELENDWHYSSLEKIFIENRIYRDIEECETWEAVLQAIDLGLTPFKPLLRREITQEDILRLTEIKIKRISKFDAFKADELIKGLEAEMEVVKNNLNNLIEYSIKWYQDLKKKYHKGRERKTEIRSFDTIQATSVAIANEKLYVNRIDGFAGYGLKKDEFISECSDMDDIIVFRRDGKFTVSKVSEKSFFGKDIIHISVFKKNEERMVYNLIYVDAKEGVSYAKRFNVTGITRDKEYDLTKGEKGSKVLYFSANPNSESEIVTFYLSPLCKARVKVLDFDFAEIGIKGRAANGNIASRYPIKRILFKSKGASTLGGREIWIDEVTGRLNTESRGKYLGSFDGEDKIICIYDTGNYELTNYEITNRYDIEHILLIAKFNIEKPITALYYHAGNKKNYVKKFNIETLTQDKKFLFIAEDKGSKLLFATLDTGTLEILSGNSKNQIKAEVELNQNFETKGWKALGNKVCENDLINWEFKKDETIIPAQTIEVGTTIEFDLKNNSTDQLEMF